MTTEKITLQCEMEVANTFSVPVGNSTFDHLFANTLHTNVHVIDEALVIEGLTTLNTLSMNVHAIHTLYVQALVGHPNVQSFVANDTFTTPVWWQPFMRLRVSVVGNGGNSVSAFGGGGGGAAVKLVSGLGPSTNIAVTVAQGHNVSFGAYLWATAGDAGHSPLGPAGAGGAGFNGDQNYVGADGDGANGGDAGGPATAHGRGADAPNATGQDGYVLVEAMGSLVEIQWLGPDGVPLVLP